MVKIIKVIILTILFPLFIHAQQVRFGVEGGMNLSGIKTNDDRESNPKGLSLGWQISGTATYEFNNHITLMSSLTLMHTWRKAKFSPWYGGYFPKVEIKTNQLTLPLKAGYTFHICDALSITPFLGSYASYHFSGGNGNINHYEYVNGSQTLINAKWGAMHRFNYYIYIVDENGDIINASMEYIDPLRHWTWGATGGINATIKDHYTISLQYMEDIKRIQKELNFRVYSLMLSLSYKF